MITSDNAFYSFWSSFGVPAFEENSVPDEQPFPYITYQSNTGFFNEPLTLTASIWTRSTSWVKANELSRAVAEKIGRGGIFVPYDGGSIWVHRGAPFAQRMGEPSDDKVKRVVLNTTVEFLTDL